MWLFALARVNVTEQNIHQLKQLALSRGDLVYDNERSLLEYLGANTVERDVAMNNYYDTALLYKNHESGNLSERSRHNDTV